MSLKSNGRFLRLFSGRLITNAGDSAYLIAAMWLIYELTGSAFYTGLAGFLVRGPNAVRFLVGPLVDRWKPRPILVVTQLVEGVLILVVPIAAALGRLSVGLLLVVLPVVSLIDQIVSPTEKAVLPQIVDDEQLVRANSLISFAENGTDVAFNAASGVLIAAVGASALFVLDAATFFVAGALFVGVTIPEKASSGSGTESPSESASEPASESGAESNYFDEMRTGFGYVRGSIILVLAVGAMAINFGIGATIAILPKFADTFGGSEVYGFLMAAITAGGFIGAGAATLVEDQPYGRVAVATFLSAGIAFSLATAVSGAILTAVLVFVTFVPIGVFNVLFFSLVQSAVRDDLLGRVSSIASSLNVVTFPIGSLVGGFLAEQFSLNAVLYMFAGSLVALGLYCLVHPRIRSLPAIAEADERTLGLGG